MRSIRGHVITSIEEAIDFYDSEMLKKVVVKPLYSAGSVDVRLCDDKNEMIRSIEDVFSQKVMYGNDLNELLIQEQIECQEYIVNTVSCNGIHRLTSILKYKKIKPQKDAIFIIIMQEYHNFCKLWMNCKLSILFIY